MSSIEDKSSEVEAVRSQKSFEFTMASVAYPEEAADFRWSGMKNMNARYHS